MLRLTEQATISMGILLTIITASAMEMNMNESIDLNKTVSLTNKNLQMNNNKISK